MKQLPLVTGGFAVVDDDDFEWAQHFRWRQNPVSGYVYRAAPNGGIYLHRMVMEPCDPFLIDHKNHNVLDNRKCNLRLCTAAENAWNRRSKNPWRGTAWHAITRKWKAGIIHNGKYIYLGVFEKRDDAAAAYEKARQELQGEFYSEKTA